MVKSLMIFLSLLILALPVSADVIVVDDPRLSLDPASGGGGGTPSPTPVVLPFTFVSPFGTSPGANLQQPCFLSPSNIRVDFCEFLNATGSDITGFTITALPGDPPVSCGDFYDGFTCTAIQQGGGAVPSILRFSGGDWPRLTALRIPVEGWTAQTAFIVAADVPEPSPGWLAASGLLIAALWGLVTRLRIHFGLDRLRN